MRIAIADRSCSSRPYARITTSIASIAIDQRRLRRVSARDARRCVSSAAPTSVDAVE
jgi:hypothetical protein